MQRRAPFGLPPNGCWRCRGAIDYRVPEVRAYAIENALHWLRDYRFDGLRLDAVHTIVTPGEPSILTDLSPSGSSASSGSAPAERGGSSPPALPRSSSSNPTAAV